MTGKPSIWLPWVALCTLAGCSDAPPAAPAGDTAVRAGPLVKVFEWKGVPTRLDPFYTGDPDIRPCGLLEVGPENLGGVWVYSVQTGECNWHTIAQPSVLPMVPGDLLQLRVWHFQLIADGPATAHVRLTVNGQLWASIDEPIPNIGRMIVVDMPVTESIPAGSEVVFHLDNHGINSWHLVDLILNPAVEDTLDSGFSELDGGTRPSDGGSMRTNDGGIDADQDPGR